MIDRTINDEIGVNVLPDFIVPGAHVRCFRGELYRVMSIREPSRLGNSYKVTVQPITEAGEPTDVWCHEFYHNVFEGM